jgi:hypothetical protein
MRNLTSHALKQAIRTKYAWPGGYTLFGITSDGACLCVDCIRQEFRSVVWSRLNQCGDGWRVVAIECAANLESVEFIKENENTYSFDHCANCNIVLND